MQSPAADTADNCPKKFNPNQTDQDGDRVGDVCDNCRNTTNTNQKDTDNDSVGDLCDEDDDNDGRSKYMCFFGLLL